ncbi:transposable element Tcb1 transposase [Trichonephila clavipes]|nr:transposable element Tcb1 transposase [Trichonephila clavipes]
MKKNSEDVFSELGNGITRLHPYMKMPELYCSIRRSNHWEVGGRPQCDKCGCRVRNCLQHRFSDFGDNFKLQEQLSGGSVLVVHEEPHPQMTGNIVLQARRNRRQIEGEIARHTTQATGRPIYRALSWPEDCTVVVCLYDALVTVCTFNACPSEKGVLCGAENTGIGETMNGDEYLFTDESRFSLSKRFSSHTHLERAGSRNHLSNIIERDRYGGRGVSHLGSASLAGSRTDLHIFDAGSVNGTRYCNEILLPYVRLFRGAMGRRLAARTLLPVTIRELRLALKDEWAAMPQQLINTLILMHGADAVKPA